MGSGCRSRLWVVALVVCLASAGDVRAEVQRVEAVGVVPLASASARVGALDQAVQAALREAVSRVARDFLLEAEPGDSQDLDLDQVLGERMVPYTTRFRILEDRGERPAMFGGGSKSEYVVEVEVFVDAERVQQRLVEAGLVRPDAPSDDVARIEIELRGLESYGAYEAVRALLTERLDARRVLPRSFESGTAVLEVELEDGDARSLGERLVELSGDGLDLRPVELDRRWLAVAVDWTPPADGGVDPAARGR